ncbi:DNA polymerase eta-like [Camellia sinensis]|uniref:DNA polymerase eta-like n=1 Tax=Camellia sinensis TaxID=4442 RepID=UPI001035C447|nr:DNA polymerase eta-like [Camellia sinensis]
MPVARLESSGARVIAHLDMDCFYVQVEQRKQPYLRGQPTAVVQYNSWKGGGLLAVSYEARKYGVKRSMRGDEAKQVCPQIQLVQVPVARGKADLTIYRNAGSEVVSILARKGRCERASIDEVYLDLTDAAEAMLAETPPESLEKIDEEALKSHILNLNEDGSDHKDNVRECLHRSDADHLDKLLACGALIVAELRRQVLKETEFTCSAGIAHNKMLAKLESGMNKPAQQTVVPFTFVKGLLEHLPIKKIEVWEESVRKTMAEMDSRGKKMLMIQSGLGLWGRQWEAAWGKLGSSLQIDLGVNTVGELLQFSEEKLQERYGVNTGTWLRNIARGISGEEVEGRLLPKSHGSGKTFPGPQALKKIASVEHWLNELCEELSERLHSDLEQNKRIAHTLTLHARAFKSSDSELQKNFPSKSCPLRYGSAKIKEDALNLFQVGLREYLGSHRIKAQGSHYNGWRITSLSVTVSKIVAIPSGTCSIMKYFHGQDQSNCSSRQVNDRFVAEAAPLSPSGTFCNFGKVWHSFRKGKISRLHTTELPIEFREEETRIRYAMPSLDQQENKGEVSTREDTCETMQSTDDHVISCSLSKQAHDAFIQETSALSSSGTESCLALNPIEPHTEFPKKEIGIKNLMHDMRPHDHKRKMVKHKGSSTILRFFQSCNNSSSSPKQEHVRTIDETKASSSSSFQSIIGSSELIEAELRKKNLLTQTGTHSGMSILDRDDMRRDAWDYKIDEIDPIVVNELPPEIQEELQVWL